MGIIHSKASVDISTTPKASEPAVKVTTVSEDGDVPKENNTEVEVKVDALETKDEAGHLKPEVLDVKESRVASLKRNLSFSKMKKMFSKGEAGGADAETKEGADDAKVEVTSDEVGDVKDEAKDEEANKEAAVPEEKAAVAEGDSKVTEWKNSLFKMFSRESADNEVFAVASTKEEGTEEQEVEGAGDGLKTEESLEEKAEGESKMTNLKKRLSFKAIKGRFSKEKKEEEEATTEKKNEEDDGKEEVKTGDVEAIKVASDDGTGEMEPPTEAPPAVPVEPVTEEEANAKKAQPDEPSEDGTLGEIGTPNADNTDIAVEGAAESLASKTS